MQQLMVTKRWANQKTSKGGIRAILAYTKVDPSKERYKCLSFTATKFPIIQPCLLVQTRRMGWGSCQTNCRSGTTIQTKAGSAMVRCPTSICTATSASLSSVGGSSLRWKVSGLRWGRASSAAFRQVYTTRLSPFTPLWRP